jgi:hypothetical protein
MYLLVLYKALFCASEITNTSSLNGSDCFKENRSKNILTEPVVNYLGIFKEMPILQYVRMAAMGDTFSMNQPVLYC